jgi:hypothetical protein
MKLAEGVTRIGRLEKKKEEEENNRSQEDTIDGEKKWFRVPCLLL